MSNAPVNSNAGTQPKEAGWRKRSRGVAERPIARPTRTARASPPAIGAAGLFGAHVDDGWWALLGVPGDRAREGVAVVVGAGDADDGGFRQFAAPVTGGLALAVLVGRAIGLSATPRDLFSPSGFLRLLGRAWPNQLMPMKHESNMIAFRHRVRRLRRRRLISVVPDVNP